MRCRLVWPALLAAALLGGGIAVAHDDEHHHGRGRDGRDSDEAVPRIADPLVRAECGECHMAFQPAFLPARSWAKLMDNLTDHFGDEVTLPADKAAAIRAYLMANAGDAGGQEAARHFMRSLAADAVPLRITETPSFTRWHNFPDRIWRSPKVVTKSNCLACHPGADQGLYDDE